VALVLIWQSPEFPCSAAFVKSLLFLMKVILKRKIRSIELKNISFRLKSTSYSELFAELDTIYHILLQFFPNR